MEANDTVNAFFCVDDPELGPLVDQAVRGQGKTLAHVLDIKAAKAPQVKDEKNDKPAKATASKAAK